jgi:UPF0176 protein
MVNDKNCRLGFMSTYEILLYYKYINIPDPDQFCAEQKMLCQKLGLKGRIIITSEGINGTVEGLKENTHRYVDEMLKDRRFKNMNFKRSKGTGNAFPKLSVKSRTEIVSAHLGDDDVNPNITTGKYLSAEDLHSWIYSDKEFYIVDMRNEYEHSVGFFRNSVLPPLKNFRDLPKILPELEHLKNKTVVTVCTGGVRCEKASGFLVKHGFQDVYQLHNGIVSYMEKYPNEDFLGKLYVFDGRVTMGFNSPDKPAVVVGKCKKCGASSEHFVNCAEPSCHDHFICCEKCLDKKGEAFCNWKCALLKKLRDTFPMFKHSVKNKRSVW